MQITKCDLCEAELHESETVKTIRAQVEPKDGVTVSMVINHNQGSDVCVKCQKSFGEELLKAIKS